MKESELELLRALGVRVEPDFERVNRSIRDDSRKPEIMRIGAISLDSVGDERLFTSGFNKGSIF